MVHARRRVAIGEYACRAAGSYAIQARGAPSRPFVGYPDAAMFAGDYGSGVAVRADAPPFHPD
jgi:hypothetical protein